MAQRSLFPRLFTFHYLRFHIFVDFFQSCDFSRHLYEKCVSKGTGISLEESRDEVQARRLHTHTHTARQRLVPPVTASLMFLESIIKCFWWTWIGNGHSWTTKSETGWGFSVFADSAYLQKSLVHNPHEYGGENVLTYVQELEQFDLLLFIAFKMLYLS